jgi:hypothetical protein
VGLLGSGVVSVATCDFVPKNYAQLLLDGFQSAEFIPVGFFVYLFQVFGSPGLSFPFFEDAPDHVGLE